MKLDVVVLHAVGDDMFWRHNPRTPKHHAHTFHVEADSIETASNLIWTLTNIGSTDELRLHFPHLAQYAQQVTHYRERKNRSLSVGDVLVFLEGERPAGTLAIEPVGHKELPKPPPVDLSDLANGRTESLAYEAHQVFRETVG